ncbi:plexin domain-containing protein 1-like [Saccostrea cucullata]|uniref:plexin domain-containing protein 1-like n=1 Tax=Saccostrea cuccullata TaxID=36930 RepID=UPI002ED6AD3A
MATLYSMNIKIAVLLHVFVCSQLKFTYEKDVFHTLQNGESTDDEIITSFKRHHMLKKRQISNSSSGIFRTADNQDFNKTKSNETPQYTGNVVIENHGYYTSKVITKPPDFNEYWVDLNNAKGHEDLVKEYRKAIRVNLNFEFRFYGNNVTKIYIANSGFLSMAQFPHQYLTATQYIAPLMANFDPTISEGSNIFYKDFGDRFVVEWKNLYLQDKNDTTPFHFQTTLHANGTIYFAYKQIPVEVSEIDTNNHPVKVGVSDAYYMDFTRQGVKRRTIYEYNRLEIDFKLVRSGTVVILIPLKTCNIAKDCTTCLTQDDSFDCKWCPMVGRCSDGLDWLRQEWLDQDCDRKAFDDSGKCNISAKEPENNTLSS